MKTALILAGGEGTRLRPLTLKTPKALIPIQGITLTEHVIEKIKEAGVEKVYLSVGYLSEKVIDYFKDKDLGVGIEYLVEKEALGTGGCLNLISDEQRQKDFSQDFIVINGDNLFDLNWDNMYQIHKKNNALITVALTKVENVSAYGVVELSDDRILRFVEKPSPEEAPSNFINSGYYIFSNRIFDNLPKKKKFMLEYDLFPAIASKKELFGYIDEAQWFDTGTAEQLEEVIKYWRKK